MDQLEKIDLAASSSKSTHISEKIEETHTGMSRRRLRLKKVRKPLLILAGILVVLTVFIIFGVVLPAMATYNSAKKTYAQAKLAYDAIKKQNVEVASTELVKTQTELKETQNNLNRMAYLQFIPIANMYYNDADHLMKAGDSVLKAGLLMVDSVKPYADVLGLKGQGSFVMGSAEQRIQTAVQTMGKITPRIDEIADHLTAAQKEIDQVDPNHYPPIFGGEKIRNNLAQLRKFTDEGVMFVNEARPLIKVLPELLGESKEKKYLIIFQNDKELRPTGGFITAYAIFKVEKGIIKVEKSDDIYTLDNTIRNKPKAPEPILKYLPKVPTLNLRDSNLSPDFIESMKQFQELYDQASGKVDVDGIIALDTHMLVSVIKILDDEVKVGDMTFTTKIDDRCDCPQVIYELEDNISRPVNYVRTGRKDLLGQLLYAIMEKAMRSSPKVYWGPLFQSTFTQIGQKHAMFYLFDKDAQSGIEALNAAGRIKATDGDYLHINDTNFSGAKSNLYVQQAVTQDIQVAGDGTITKTLTIKFKNPYPPSDCNLERGGLCLNALHRDWIRVYVPKGSTLVDSSGSQVKVSTYEELGKTVFDGFVTVKPEGLATYMLKYKLPFKLEKGSVLPLLIQKQPGTADNEYIIEVNGKTVQKFPLLTDVDLKLNP